MSSFFELTLDTTAPTLSIYVPYYTILGIDVPVSIEASEKISQFEIYAVNSEGERKDYTFSIDDDTILYGDIDNVDTAGILHIFVRVADDVGNWSNEYEATLLVIPIGALNTCDILVSIGNTVVQCSTACKEVEQGSYAATIESSLTQAQIGIEMSTPNVEIGSEIL